MKILKLKRTLVGSLSTRTGHEMGLRSVWYASCRYQKTTRENGVRCRYNSTHALLFLSVTSSWNCEMMRLEQVHILMIVVSVNEMERERR